MLSPAYMLCSGFVLALPSGMELGVQPSHSCGHMFPRISWRLGLSGFQSSVVWECKLASFTRVTGFLEGSS